VVGGLIYGSNKTNATTHYHDGKLTMHYPDDSWRLLADHPGKKWKVLLRLTSLVISINCKPIERWCAHEAMQQEFTRHESVISFRPNYEI
jgi:hypothetical protein